MENSDLEEVKCKISKAETSLEEAERNNDREMILRLNDRLNLLLAEKARLAAPQSADIKKRISVSFKALNALNEPATVQNFTFSEKTFPLFIAGHDIKYLMQADSSYVYLFEELVNDGIYHAERKFDAQVNRYYVDDEIFEMEASTFLLSTLNGQSNNAHLHQNLKFYKKMTDKVELAQYDAIVHGRVEDDIFAIVLEAKTKVHPDDITRALQKRDEFEEHISSKPSLWCTSGYSPSSLKQPLTHFQNVKRVIPCLAGKHFSSHLIDDCCNRGIIPIYPSGARYFSKLLHALPTLLK